MMSLGHLENIRNYELGCVLPHIPKGSQILEIGAGTGWQARELERHGFEVIALDIPDSRYKGRHVREVLEYDGSNIPFPEDSFDVVFSSNTLEHISHLHSFLKELRRVLKPGGIGVHVLPTSIWRFFTNLSHYPFVIQVVYSRLSAHTTQSSQSTFRVSADDLSNISLSGKIRRSIASSRHGEHGSFITEMYYFNRFYWNRVFLKTGWTIEKRLSNNLLYTGYGVFDSRISLKTRTLLSRFLGSSCHIYVTRKAHERSSSHNNQ